MIYSGGIQDFTEGAPTPRVGVLTYYFAFFLAANCMKMKEFGPGGGQGSANDLGFPRLHRAPTVKEGAKLLFWPFFPPKLHQNASLDTPMTATV